MMKKTNKKIYNFFCICLVILGLYRSVFYFIGKAFHSQMNNQQLFYFAISPSPLVFDKINYFTESDIVIHFKDGKIKTLDGPGELQDSKGPWQRKIIHRHAMLYLYRKSPSDFISYADYYYCRLGNIKELNFSWDYQKINDVSGTHYRKREIKVECR